MSLLLIASAVAWAQGAPPGAPAGSGPGPDAPPPAGSPPGFGSLSPGARVGGIPPAPAARGPALDVALELAQESLAACAADKLSVTTVVVDSAGFVKVSLMADGARSLTPTFAARAAVTALEFRMSSGEVAKQAQTDESVKVRLAANSNLFAAAGAVLLKAGDETLGALAVNGAGADQNEACALKALQKVGPRLK